MSLSADNLRRIVAAIWSTQLGLELLDADVEQLEELLGEDAAVCGLDLSGEFKGMLVQRCSRALSIVAAAAAFAASGQDLGATDVRDTVSELAHVTAGNIKSLLPGRTTVSLPHPLEGDSYSGETMVEVGFTLDGEPLVVTLKRYT
jgi:chemotaxis protein CheX